VVPDAVRYAALDEDPPPARFFRRSPAGAASLHAAAGIFISAREHARIPMALLRDRLYTLVSGFAVPDFPAPAPRCFTAARRDSTPVARLMADLVGNPPEPPPSLRDIFQRLPSLPPAWARVYTTAGGAITLGSLLQDGASDEDPLSEHFSDSEADPTDPDEGPDDGAYGAAGASASRP